MTNPTLPNVPFPPLLNTVSIQFKDWQKHLQTKSNEFVNVVAFKLVMFGWKEVIYSFGYLSNADQTDVLTGDARLEGEDYNFNPETAWHGGDSLGPQMRRKLPLTATLVTSNGHSQILLDFGSAQQMHYTATLTAVSGHDASFNAAMLLTGDRTGITVGKVTGSFDKTFIEKTHWPPSF